ncbi:MAG: hypothetical protein CMG90_01970 [Marinobacter sp.]|nr:hypothetical protein [Marinobacter sp.]
MRWILAFTLCLLPLSSAHPTVIDYKIIGQAERLRLGESHEITVDFSVDTLNWHWVSLSVDLWGRTWTPTDPNNNLLDIWSEEPEGEPTLWFDWSPSVESFGEVLRFQPFPEWKLHLSNVEVARDPLSFLDQSFFVNEFASLNTGEILGLSGRITKVAQVPEGLSILLLIGGLILLGGQQMFSRDSFRARRSGQ